MIRTFRLFRLLGLVRAVMLMGAVAELRRLIQMMGPCIRTPFWSFVLTFISMTMWSVALVEFVSPIIRKLDVVTGFWGGDAVWTMS